MTSTFFSSVTMTKLLCAFHAESKRVGRRNVRRGREKATHRWKIILLNHRNCYCKSLGHNAREITLKLKVVKENYLFSPLIQGESWGYLIVQG